MEKFKIPSYLDEWKELGYKLSAYHLFEEGCILHKNKNRIKIKWNNKGLEYHCYVDLFDEDNDIESDNFEDFGSGILFIPNEKEQELLYKESRIINPKFKDKQNNGKILKIYIACSFAYEDKKLTNERKETMKEIQDYLESDEFSNKINFARVEVYNPSTLKIKNAWDYSYWDWGDLVYQEDKNM